MHCPLGIQTDTESLHGTPGTAWPGPRLCRTEHPAFRPQLQERLTKRVADCPHTHLEPKGVGAVIGAEHTCMTLRGVQATGSNPHLHPPRHSPTTPAHAPTSSPSPACPPEPPPTNAGPVRGRRGRTSSLALVEGPGQPTGTAPRVSGRPSRSARRRSGRADRVRWNGLGPTVAWAQKISPTRTRTRSWTPRRSRATRPQRPPARGRAGLAARAGAGGVRVGAVRRLLRRPPRLFRQLHLAEAGRRPSGPGVISCPPYAAWRSAYSDWPVRAAARPSAASAAPLAATPPTTPVHAVTPQARSRGPS